MDPEEAEDPEDAGDEDEFEGGCPGTLNNFEHLTKDTNEAGAEVSQKFGQEARLHYKVFVPI